MIQLQLLTYESVECVFVRLIQDNGFDPPCGSHQLPVFLKYSEVATVTRTLLRMSDICGLAQKPLVTANDNLFTIIKFTRTSSVWNFRR